MEAKNCECQKKKKNNKQIYGSIIHCRKCKVSTLCGFCDIKIFNVCRTLWTPCILDDYVLPFHQSTMRIIMGVRRGGQNGQSKPLPGNLD